MNATCICGASRGLSLSHDYDCEASMTPTPPAQKCNCDSLREHFPSCPARFVSPTASPPPSPTARPCPFKSLKSNLRYITDRIDELESEDHGDIPFLEVRALQEEADEAIDFLKEAVNSHDSLKAERDALKADKQAAIDEIGRCGRTISTLRASHSALQAALEGLRGDNGCFCFGATTNKGPHTAKCNAAVAALGGAK